MNRFGILSTAAALATAFSLHAQTSAPIPVPSQLRTANTIFLSNAGTTWTAKNEKFISQTIYSNLYQALSKTGKYQLKGSPAEAELAMNVSAVATITDVNHGVANGDSFLQLEIYDIKTHTLLWTLHEPLEGAILKKSFQQNVSQSVAALVDDLASLSNGNLPTDSTATQSQKTRTSDEGK